MRTRRASAVLSDLGIQQVFCACYCCCWCYSSRNILRNGYWVLLQIGMLPSTSVSALAPCSWGEATISSLYSSTFRSLADRLGCLYSAVSWWCTSWALDWKRSRNGVSEDGGNESSPLLLRVTIMGTNILVKLLGDDLLWQYLRLIRRLLDLNNV